MSMSKLVHFMNTSSYIKPYVISPAYVAEISYGNDSNSGEGIKTRTS
jgi:hypothetical protein